MESTHFPWRPLGALLVEQDLISPEELEEALAEQRRSGRLLGEILVDRGWLGAFSLARVLAEQHGVELRAQAEGVDAPAASPAHEPDGRPGHQWRPLGALLVEGGWVGRAELERTLAAQHATGRRLGELLVEGGYLTGPELARVLAQQQGVELPEVDAETVVTPAAPGGPTFRVCEVVEPSHRRVSVLFESANFLEAADFAFEYVETHQPGALTLERRHGESHETVWNYSTALADAHAAAGNDLVGTFGFDPVKWDVR
jgi:hypothetical protein